MSQNLTQPEEIDHVLMEMAAHNGDAGKPISEGTLLNGRNHNRECNRPDGMADFSYSVAHKNPMHGLPNP